ncbi:alpha/beta fold hydrolase [Actinoplanes subtropicus]|uniref:alpha/beta fold hydrolase n=1 Tax=Actinoplanes subtropicus TaxID=543632 RepID=UPI0004C3975C|nr:alpha/beta hydrolase [Actinoplanes subtropicus]
MTAVFVNGNPESAAIWDSLLDHLDCADVLRLSPPGFGAPIPDGFACTVTGYRDWLAGELEAIGEPVDLVGHDVGGSTVLGVAMTRPELIRTWVSDSVGVFDPDYTWHALATTWQTEGAGEASVAELLGGTIDERIARLAAAGMPETAARKVAPAQGLEMGRAILTFYRSAAQPVMARLGRDLEAAARRPGLVILGTADRFVGTETMRRRSAARAGAAVATLDDVGHWWMAQDPGGSAEALRRFWHT